MSTSCGGPCGVSTVITGWRLSGPAGLLPVTTAVEPSMVMPSMSSGVCLAGVAGAPVAAAAAVPTAAVAVPTAAKAWVCCQDAPLAETKATRSRPAVPVTAAPAWPPLVMSAWKPDGVLRVASKVQLVPFGER